MEHNNEAIFKSLLEETLAIPWRVEWATKTFSYVGPQIEMLLGWSRTSWVSVDDWAERIHPDDRQSVVGFCVAQSLAGFDHEAEYRAQTKSGQYVWIRDVVHVIRGECGITALMGFMFKIPSKKSSLLHTLTGPRSTDSLSFLFKQTFQFTRAESRLAEALINGACARSYAEHNMVSINTVRSQIRSLLDKCGVRRQVDLVRVLISSLKNDPLK